MHSSRTRELIDRSRVLGVLERILPQPTAPFHEHRVRDALKGFLEGIGLRCRLDACGNLLCAYRRGTVRPVAFSAHMDHPGFEVVSVDGTQAKALWNGQVPPFDLRGSRLALWSDDPGVGRRAAALVLSGDGRRAPERRREILLRVPRGTRPGEFGYADLTPLRVSGGWIVSKALDNVAGCAAIAACLEHLVRGRLPGNVTALFTRAEEVGFHGALAAIKAQSLSPGRPLVVLECSKAMPGADQGKGPVIRVGDKLTVFDPDLIAACESAASSWQARDPNFRFQRRLMDGGTCEATAFCLAGYRAVCLAFPLANYHNAGPRGLAPERIAERDFLDGIACLAAFATRGLDPGAARRQRRRAVAARLGAREEQRLKDSR